MHSFAIVVAKPGRAIPRGLVELLDRRDDPQLPFVPEEHLHWADDQGRVRFAGWQAFTDVLELGSHWHTDDEGLVAFSGHPWPRGGHWRRGATWASQLRDLWRADPVVSDDEQFGGVFAALSIDRQGRGTVITDPLSVAVLYQAENDDVTVIANNARLAARLAATETAPPTRDPMGTAWLVHFGYIVGESTTFAGTTAVPPGSFVEIGPRFGCRTPDRTGSPWSAPNRADLSIDEWIDLVHDDLRAGIRSVSKLPADELLADLTGGRDSRLALALMVEQGLQDRFTFRTTGAEHTPDSQVGERIASELNLRHQPIRPQPMDGTDFQNRLRTHVFQTSGMLNPWDFKGALAVARRPKVTGLLGELLRGTQQQIKDFDTEDALWTAFRKGMQLDRPSILRREVREHLDESIRSHLLEPPTAGGSSPQDLLDSFYIRNRLRRWVGTQEELGEACRVLPLYSLVGVQAAFALGAEARRSELIPFEVMRRANATLAQAPLADAGWKEDLIARLPDAEAYRADPVKPARGGTKPVQWQRSRIDDNRDVVREYLLDERSSPLFDLVDRSEVEAILTGDQGPTSRPYQQLFGAISAAIWLGGDELPARYGDGSYEPAHALGRVAPDPSRPHDEQGAESAVASRSVPAQPETAQEPHASKKSKAITAPKLPGPVADFGRRLRLTTARRLRDAAKRVAP